MIEKESIFFNPTGRGFWNFKLRMIGTTGSDYFEIHSLSQTFIPFIDFRKRCLEELTDSIFEKINMPTELCRIIRDYFIGEGNYDWRNDPTSIKI